MSNLNESSPSRPCSRCAGPSFQVFPNQNPYAFAARSAYQHRATDAWHCPNCAWGSDSDDDALLK